MKYYLTCKNYDLDYTYTVYSMDGIAEFWSNWNVKHGENMRCIHEYEFKELT
jgi:hypothetical protein